MCAFLHYTLIWAFFSPDIIDDGKAFCRAASLDEKLAAKKTKADIAEQQVNVAIQQVQFGMTIRADFSVL